MEQECPIYKLELPECVELICVPFDECIKIVEEQIEDN